MLLLPLWHRVVYDTLTHICIMSMKCPIYLYEVDEDKNKPFWLTWIDGYSLYFNKENVMKLLETFI